MAGYVKKVEQELLERVHNTEAMTMAELDAIADSKEEKVNYQLNVDKFIEFSLELSSTNEKLAFMELYLYLTKFIFSVNDNKETADNRVKTLQDKIKKLVIEYFRLFKRTPQLEELKFDEAMNEVLEFSKDSFASIGFEWAPLLYQITGVIKISL